MLLLLYASFLLQYATVVLSENVSNKQRLKVPEALRDYYNEKKSVRSGRQIVPGVYSCGHQGMVIIIDQL